MKYHATLHPNDQLEHVFECHVIADDTGQACEKIKRHLEKQGLGDIVKAEIYLVDIGARYERDMLLIP